MIALLSYYRKKILTKNWGLRCKQFNIYINLESSGLESKIFRKKKNQKPSSQGNQPYGPSSIAFLFLRSIIRMCGAGNSCI